MKKKLILEKCDDCKHMSKGYNWIYKDGETFLIVGWLCSKKHRMIEEREIHGDEIIFCDFNKEEFERDIQNIFHDIPEWCQLEDE